MVAKSYQQCELIGDPFTENGRQYIYIKRNGKERKVRWYTEAEFEKAFKVKLNTPEEKPVFAKRPKRCAWRLLCDCPA